MESNDFNKPSDETLKLPPCYACGKLWDEHSRLLQCPNLSWSFYSAEKIPPRCICGRGKYYHPWRFCDDYKPEKSK
jgi:hypothetical protein